MPYTTPEKLGPSKYYMRIEHVGSGSDLFIDLNLFWTGDWDGGSHETLVEQVGQLLADLFDESPDFTVNAASQDTTLSSTLTPTP